MAIVEAQIEEYDFENQCLLIRGEDEVRSFDDHNIEEFIIDAKILPKGTIFRAFDLSVRADFISPT